MANAMAAMPPGRAGLSCANPKCWFLVHEDPSFGGFCCKKCHWVYATSSKTKRRHGIQCAKREAPLRAPRASPQPPDKSLVEAVSPGDGHKESPKGSREPPPEQQQHHSGGEGQRGPAGVRAPCDSDLAGALVKSLNRAYVLKPTTVVGFVLYARFNDFRARVVRRTEDGRFDLQLADRTKLRWVKATNFILADSATFPEFAPMPAPAPPPPPPATRSMSWLGPLPGSSGA